MNSTTGSIVIMIFFRGAVSILVIGLVIVLELELKAKSA